MVFIDRNVIERALQKRILILGILFLDLILTDKVK